MRNQKKIRMISAVLMSVLFTACGNDAYGEMYENLIEEGIESNTDSTIRTSYPAEAVIADEVLWYTSKGSGNNLQYYNLKTETGGSLCSDPLCNHRSYDCILMPFFVEELAVYENNIIFLADYFLWNPGEKNTDESRGYYCYDMEKQEMRELYTIHESMSGFGWCVSEGYLYFKNYKETDKGQYIPHIYRIPIDGSREEAEQVTGDHSSMLYSMRVENGKVYYYENNVLTCDGKPVITDIWKLMYSIKNGNIYFSKNVYNPFQERTDAPWAYDLYRMPFDGKEDEAELLVRNVIGEVLHKGSKIYYCPYDSNAVEMVFSYLMPGEEDLMPGEEEKYRTYVYDDTNGSMSVYDEETGMRRNLFSGLDMIIRDIMGTTEDGVIVYGTDYRDVVTVGERKDTDASSYYDKTRYFFISWDGSRIEELPIEKNWPGPIVFS